MKTYNRLKNQIVAFDNLLGALKKARKGKKYKSQWSLTCIVAEDSYSIVGFELKQNCLEGSYLGRNPRYSAFNEAARRAAI